MARGWQGRQGRGPGLWAVFASAACASWLGCDGGDTNGPGPWETAFDATETGWLLNVAGPSGDDLYAVGGEPEAGAIVHFDGTEWMPLDPGVDVPLLNWVHPFGPDDLFVVGNGGTAIRFDGGSWTLLPTPTDEDLWGVWGAAPDDVWAVGGQGRAEGQATVIRFDGDRWRAVDVPELERPRVFAFFKVWGSAADDVWIVGQRGAVLHWDGQELTEHGVGTSDDLISVWGTGPDRVVAVGGRSNGVAALWNGREWRTESPSCNESGIPVPGLNGVWLRDPGRIHMVGVEGLAVVLDFDTFECEAEFLDTRKALHAVFGDDTGTLTAVGGNLATTAGPYEGVSLRRTLGNEE